MERHRCKDSKNEGQERAKAVWHATRITGAAEVPVRQPWVSSPQLGQDNKPNLLF